jgi:hypothetical protein
MKVRALFYWSSFHFINVTRGTETVSQLGRDGPWVTWGGTVKWPWRENCAWFEALDEVSFTSLLRTACASIGVFWMTNHSRGPIVSHSFLSRALPLRSWTVSLYGTRTLVHLCIRNTICVGVDLLVTKHAHFLWKCGLCFYRILIFWTTQWCSVAVSVICCKSLYF